jgi:rubrerythrin
MAAMQMLDLLKKGERFHQALAVYYRELSARAQSEEVRELLDYLSNHEDHLGRCLRQYERGAPPSVANYWFKWVPDSNLAGRIQEEALPSDARPEDVVRLARRFDDCQVQVYQELVETCPPGQMRDALGNLLEMEQQQERLLVRNLQSW